MTLSEKKFMGMPLLTVFAMVLIGIVVWLITETAGGKILGWFNKVKAKVNSGSSDK